MISNVQNALIKDGQILDVVLVTNKDVDSILRRNKGLRSNSGTILFKLDLKKASDWSFLCSIMNEMRFGVR